MNQMMPSKSIFLWKMDFPVSIIFPRAVGRRSHWFASFQLAANICQQINLLCFQNNQTPFFFTPRLLSGKWRVFQCFPPPTQTNFKCFFFFKNNHNYITFIPHFFIVILSSLKLSLKYLKRGKGLRVM